jgi:hypothetical protein
MVLAVADFLEEVKLTAGKAIKFGRVYKVI